MAEETSGICPVCNEKYLDVGRTAQQRFSKLLVCQRCGKYELSEIFREGIVFKNNRNLVSAWIQRQNRNGVDWPVVGGDYNTTDIQKWLDDLRYQGFPQTVPEKMDALLLAYADIFENIYQNQFGELAVIDDYPSLIASSAAYNLEEIIGLNGLLKESGYVYTSACDGLKPNIFRITAQGWQRIDELQKQESTGDTAFIAMWYDKSTENYEKAVKETVEKTGYRPVILKDQKYNDFIMNEAISLIRKSRFVIADLTCYPEEIMPASNKVYGGVRGGVWWEAGYAYGLGKPVIITCEDNPQCRDRIHFDLNQYRRINWTEDRLVDPIRDFSDHIDNPNFKEELALQILATVGQGSYKP